MTNDKQIIVQISFDGEEQYHEDSARFTEFEDFVATVIRDLLYAHDEAHREPRPADEINDAIKRMPNTIKFG